MREILERKLRDILDEIAILTPHVDNKDALKEACAALEAVQFIEE